MLVEVAIPIVKVWSSWTQLSCGARTAEWVLWLDFKGLCWVNCRGQECRVEGYEVVVVCVYV